MPILEHYFAADGPGAALAIALDGEAPRIECVGLADIEAGTPITADTPFELASVSKWFTATAVMLLVERQRLTLDAPVHELLRDCPRGPGRPITVRDLLCHSSGLPDYLDAGAGTPADEMSTTSVMRRLPDWMSAAVPGREHLYCNSNYVVLARIVETVTGSAFAAFVESALVAPFGLRSTTAGSPAARARRPAGGYRNLGYGMPVFEPVTDAAIDTDGDGGVVSTLHDLIRWQSLFWSGAILDPASVRLMRTPGTLDSGERFAYGLGLQVESGDGGTGWCGHAGSWTNCTTVMGRYDSPGAMVTVLSNEFMAPVERIAQRAWATATGRLPRART